jgi:hypothetical protein
MANHEPGIERKPAREFGAQVRMVDRSPNHERTRRTYADGVEVLELSSEHRRSEGSATTDVDALQKNYECHANPAGFTPAREIRR